MKNARDSALREAGVLLLFVILAIAMTWPLSAHLERAVSDPGDPYFSTWVLDWGYHATVTSAPLFDANIFHPVRCSLAFSEHTYGITVLLLPLFAAGVAPLTIHNIAVLAGFALSGYTTYILCRWVTGSTGAAIVGGIAFAFAGFRFHHLPHLPYLWTFWIPLMLLAALAYATRPSWKWAALFGGATLMNGLTSVTYFVFATPLAVLVVVFLGLYARRVRDPRFWIPLGAALLVVAIGMTPFLFPYLAVAEEYGMQRTVQEVLPNGAQWGDWLVPNLQNRNYGHLSPRENYSHERTLFPGLATLVLCGVALLFVRRDDFETELDRGDASRAAGRRALAVLDILLGVLAIMAWAGSVSGEVRLGPLSYTGATTPLFLLFLLLGARLWMSAGRAPLPERIARSRYPAALWGIALWLAVSVLGARGLHGFFHSFLFERISAYRGLRMPIRWSILAYVALAVIAAAGMLPLFRGRSRAVRAAITIAFAGVMLFELRSAPIRYYLVPLEPRSVYEWIRDTPIRGAVLELPMTSTSEYEYLWRSTVHHKPLLNGVSSFIPPSYDRMREIYAHEPIPDALFDLLEREGCSLVVVHPGSMREREGAIREWLARGVASGRLSFVRRFDAGPRGDWVFAVSRVEPQAARWREPEVPDPAGFTPSENAAKLLGGETWLWTRAPFVSLDRAPFGTLRGPQEFHGWVHDPNGVSEVRVRFANGRMTARAELFDRPDVRQILAWAPESAIRGFSVTLDRPRFIDGDTDFQVELVDARGARTLMPPMFFVWRDTVPVSLDWDRGRLRALLERLGAKPDEDSERVVAGTAAIGDFTSDLLGDAERESDVEFVERVLPILLGGPPSPSTSSRFLALTAGGAPRERVIEAILESRAFRSAYSVRERSAVSD